MEDSAGSDRTLQRALAKAIAKSWRDPGFREQLINDPVSALSSIGAEVPHNVRLQVIPDGTAILPLPAPTQDGEVPRDAVNQAWLALARPVQ